MTKSTTRREFLVAGGAAPLALAFAGQSGSRELTAAEQANVDVVNGFCDAWATRDADQIASFLADDAVFRFTQDGDAATGSDTFRQMAGGFLADASDVRFDVLETWAVGPLVVNLRVDYFTTADGQQEFRVGGVFYVNDGKIVEWIDALAPA
ncbi:MAG: nuclear transport factor 2 family protein [Acidobacteria bacterium]|nr:nuclear transport factor 2 family protein [Acidobacteriota bacterium]